MGNGNKTRKKKLFVVVGKHQQGKTRSATI